jgi:hypothetical protein
MMHHGDTLFSLKHAHDRDDMPPGVPHTGSDQAMGNTPALFAPQCCQNLTPRPHTDHDSLLSYDR